MKHVVAVAVIALLFSACTAAAAAPVPTAAPAPTPLVIVKTVEIPGPQPTPEIVQVAPAVCGDALDKADEIISDFASFLKALGDGDSKEADKVTTATGKDLDTFTDTSAQCRALLEPTN